MTLPNKSVIFETLNTKRHNTDDNIQSSLFPDLDITPQKNHSEFWYYSDLHNLHGNPYFPIEPNMNAHVWQHLVMPTQNAIKRSTPQLIQTNLEFYNDHITTMRHDYSLDGNRRRNA